jgi:1-acyl-sn-glycerol-3-phosphate acyltransferase
MTYIRGAVMMIYIVLATLVFSLLTLFFSIVLRAPDFAFEVNKYLWGRVILKLVGVRLDVRGHENLPQNGRGYLYLFNHTSYMDIIAMISGLPKPPKFGAKIELFKIPFFGSAMRALGHLPIARDQRHEVLKLYKETESRVDRGEVFALAPEGTRQSGGVLGRFKKGPFIFAVGAKMPIIPLVIVGAEQVQPKGSFLMNVGKWKRTIVLQILPPIDAAPFANEKIEVLQEATKVAMAKEYARLQEELKDQLS